MNTITGSGVVRMIARQKTTGGGHPVEDVDMGRGTERVTGITTDGAMIIIVVTIAGPSFITPIVTRTPMKSIGH